MMLYTIRKSRKCAIKCIYREINKSLHYSLMETLKKVRISGHPLDNFVSNISHFIFSNLLFSGKFYLEKLYKLNLFFQDFNAT